MTQTATRTPIQLAAALCALMMGTFLFAEPASAQFEREWERSKAQGNAHAFIATDSEIDDGKFYFTRGLAYGEVDDGSGTTVERLFVASNGTVDGEQPYRIYVVDPSNGDRLGFLNDISTKGGFRFLNDVGVSDDGVIFAANAAVGGQTFYIYKWESLDADPTIVYQDDGTELDFDRVGSNISVTGSTGDNLQIHVADAGSESVYQFDSNFDVTELTTPNESNTPNVEDAYPDPDGGYYHTYVNVPAERYNANESVAGQLPQGVADSLVSLNIFEVSGEKFLVGAKNDYGGNAGVNDRARLAQITNGAGNATMYGETPTLGSTSQFQGNGDADVRVNGDGTVTVFHLSTHDGIGAFTTNQDPLGPPTVDGVVDDVRYEELGTVTSDQISSPQDYSGEGLVSLKAYRDSENLYVGVEGNVRMDIGEGSDFRDIVLWVNAEGPGPDGTPEGDALLPGSAGDSPFGYVDGMTMEMEVDYGFRFTGDPGTNQGYPSIVDYTTVNECSDDQGNTFDCHPDEFEAVVPGDGTPAGGVATHAFQNASSLSEADNNNSGWEFAVPLDEIGATSDSEFQLFVAYGNPDDESDDIGSIISAHIIPDDGESMAYDPDQDWTSVSGMQATDANPLPVELASFDASRDGSGVVLNWSTASETNNAGFEVQHARAEGSFEVVGFVDGAGTTESAQSYDFRVSELEGGTHRFRLKQVDLDGSTSLSGVVEVNVRPDGPIAIQEVSPNPVTGTGTLSFTLRESGEVDVSLYDVLGRQVKTLRQGRATAGQHQVSLDASGLSSGVYFLGIEGDGFTETRRLTVVR